MTFGFGKRRQLVSRTGFARDRRKIYCTNQNGAQWGTWEVEKGTQMSRGYTEGRRGEGSLIRDGISGGE